MLERDVVKHFTKRCKEIGAMCEQFSSQGRRGVPDRIMIFKGEVWFVEFKAPGKEPTVLQIRDHARRRSHGALVVVIDSINNVDEFIQILRLHSVQRAYG